MQKKTGTNNKALRILQLIGSVYLLICTGAYPSTDRIRVSSDLYWRNAHRFTYGRTLGV